MTKPAPNLGRKFTCFKCECKFYDLGADVPLCPRCGADQREDPNPDPRAAFLASLRRSPARRSKARAKKKTEPAPPTLDTEESLLDADGEEDEAVEEKAKAKAEAKAKPKAKAKAKAK